MNGRPKKPEHLKKKNNTVRLTDGDKNFLIKMFGSVQIGVEKLIESCKVIVNENHVKEKE